MTGMLLPPLLLISLIIHSRSSDKDGNGNDSDGTVIYAILSVLYSPVSPLVSLFVSGISSRISSRVSRWTVVLGLSVFLIISIWTSSTYSYILSPMMIGISLSLISILISILISTVSYTIPRSFKGSFTPSESVILSHLIVGAVVWIFTSSYTLSITTSSSSSIIYSTDQIGSIDGIGSGGIVLKVSLSIILSLSISLMALYPLLKRIKVLYHSSSSFNSRNSHIKSDDNNNMSEENEGKWEWMSLLFYLLVLCGSLFILEVLFRHLITNTPSFTPSHSITNIPFITPYSNDLLGCSVCRWTFHFVFWRREHVFVIGWWAFCLFGAGLGWYYFPDSTSSSSTKLNSSKSSRKSNSKIRSSATTPTPSRLTLDTRRKSFHILSCMMFIPPSHRTTSHLLTLSYGIAFALFILGEAVRVFKVWIPLGDVEVFDRVMRSFIDASTPTDKNKKHDEDDDEKEVVLQSPSAELKNDTTDGNNHGGRNWDDGPVILSHFYLLSAAAIPHFVTSLIPLTHHNKYPNDYDGMLLMRCVGVVLVGVGDTAAAICGHKYGRHRWHGRKKTLEGSLGFFIFSLFACQIISYFDTLIAGGRGSGGGGVLEGVGRNAIVCAGAAVLEAVSYQNDNLILSMWSCAALLLLTPPHPR